jgi:ParB family chromosome partitioning protein
MVTKRNALGKGLSALLENYETDVTSSPARADSNHPKDAAAKVAGAIANIPINCITANPFQPRDHFEEEALNELTASIKKFHIIQPITVRKMGYDQYQIISGERRYRASCLAGLDEIPCYIRIANDQEMLEMALVENIQREHLNAIEIAIGYKRLIKECNLTQDELSGRIGKKRSTITNYLRLLKLPAEIQLAIKTAEIQMGHARAIINVEDEKMQELLFKKIVQKGLSVRQVEDFVRNLEISPVKKENIQAGSSAKVKRYTYQLSTHFGSDVELKQFANKKGKIIIPFSSEKDLNRILGILDL